MPRATGTGERSVGTGRFWRVLRKKKNWGQCLSTSPRPAGAGHNDVRGVDSPPRAIKCRRMPLRSLSFSLISRFSPEIKYTTQSLYSPHKYSENGPACPPKWSLATVLDITTPRLMSGHQCLRFGGLSHNTEDLIQQSLGLFGTLCFCHADNASKSMVPLLPAVWKCLDVN